MSDIDITMSPECADLFAALAAFQGEVTPPKKTASNPHFKSKFADLADVLEAVRAPLAKHGLALLQVPVGSCDGQVRVVTLVTHKSGQWLKGTIDMPLTQKTPQGVGSAISYARRYCAMAALGIAAEDDDGESAEGRGGKPQQKPQETQAQQQAPGIAKTDPAKLFERLHAELAQMHGSDMLADYHNHAVSEMNKAGIPVEARDGFWAAWGKRCEDCKLKPPAVAAIARRKQEAA